MRVGLVLVLLAASFFAGLPLLADEVEYPNRPGQRDFVLDEAHLIKPKHVEQIRNICTAVLDEKQAPIIVVTIPSLATYGAGHWPIQRYAMELFDEWGIGHPELNHGMLLLVSKGDRKARIELGAEWGREHDRQARRIMAGSIIANFKRGRFSEGIVAGVNGLADLARGRLPEAPPPRSRPREDRKDTGPRWYTHPLVWVLGLFVIASLVSIFKQGRDGWGYKAWKVILVILTVLFIILQIVSIFTGDGDGIDGGSFGGGSFGGGSSGGGGATGSW